MTEPRPQTIAAVPKAASAVIEALRSVIAEADSGTTVIVGAKTYRLDEAPEKAVAVYVRAKTNAALEGQD